jgi:plastocyanin
VRTRALLLVAAPLLAAACASTPGSSPSPAPAYQPTTVVVDVPGADYFSPWLVSVHAGDTVEWTNHDTDNHLVQAVIDERYNTAAPGGFIGNALGTQHTPDGSAGTYRHTFTKPGYTFYFCAIHANVNTTTHEAEPHANASVYPAPMFGVVVVLPDTSATTQASSYAPATVKISVPTQDYFTPWLTAIHVGDTVTWFNGDTDNHLVQAPVDPATDSALHGKGIVQMIHGTKHLSEGPEGYSQKITSTGVLFYFCAMHASIDSKTNEPVAHPDASAFPSPMFGVIVVLPDEVPLN